MRKECLWELSAVYFRGLWKVEKKYWVLEECLGFGGRGMNFQDLRFGDH